MLWWQSRENVAVQVLNYTPRGGWARKAELESVQSPAQWVVWGV